MPDTHDVAKQPGVRCVVTDLRNGTIHAGVIIEVRADGKLVVRYDGGSLVAVGAGFVKVTDA